MFEKVNRFLRKMSKWNTGIRWEVSVLDRWWEVTSVHAVSQHAGSQTFV